MFQSVKSALIIGGGFAGCAAAHQLELIGGFDVTLVESAPFHERDVETADQFKLMEIGRAHV